MVGVGTIFVGVDLDTETRHGIAAALTKVPLVGIPSPPSNWHITLRYLGDVSELEYDRVLFELEAAIATTPFRVSFAGLGAFPKTSHATVLWLGVNMGESNLISLAQEIDDACESAGLGREDRPFVPHLTLARIRPPQDVWVCVEHEPMPAVRLQVGHVSVFRSDRTEGGMVYSVLDTIDL